MNRFIALRAFLMFSILTVFAAVTGWASQGAVAEAIFLIGAPLSAVMLFFAFAKPIPNPVPVRIRRRR